MKFLPGENVRTMNPHLDSSLLNNAMSAYQEKWYFGLGGITTAGMSGLGAILSPVDSRWVFITLACSIMMAVALTLSFKKPDETIKTVLGKAMISVLCGVFLTKLAVYYFNLSTAHTDLIVLGGVACLCCAFGYILGWAGLKYLSKRSDAIAENFIESKFKSVISKKDPDKS